MFGKKKSPHTLSAPHTDERILVQMDEASCLWLKASCRRRAAVCPNAIEKFCVFLQFNCMVQSTESEHRADLTHFYALPQNIFYAPSQESAPDVCSLGHGLGWPYGKSGPAWTVTVNNSKRFR
ncbi:hypothetical protein AVEN_19214-1 [Araneus ventricosus]|uniref:Uncharacterized protein n=1 Tax=Araneus ventricosus TaxID=182803 RepID=A0A4Y2SH42_ARAVE|nr:hypothetical protein AVEN_19214-1 [Araneus ventricosus]